MTKIYKYQAFISYSHKDQRFATWLHKNIENYSIPKHLKELYLHLPKNLKRSIFKDNEELSSSSSLSQELKMALQNSKKLIVICSQNAKDSKWVNEEIRYFISINNINNIITVIKSGEPIKVLPSILKQEDEPLSVDAREKSMKKFALLKILATLLEIDFASLQSREKKETHKRLFLKILTLSLFFVVAMYAYSQVLLLSSSKVLDKQQNDNAYEYALFLEQQKQHNKARTVLERLLKHDLDSEEQANVLNRLGILYRKLKQPKKAEESYLKALNKRTVLATSHPKLYGNDLAWTYNNLGVLYKETKQNKKAESSHFKALAIRQELEKENKHAEKLYVSCSMHNIGELYASTLQIKKAKKAFMHSLSIRRNLVRLNPKKFNPMLAATLHELACLHQKNKKYQEAEDVFLETLKLREALLKQNASAYKTVLLETVSKLIELYAVTNQIDKEKALSLKYNVLQ